MLRLQSTGVSYLCLFRHVLARHLPRIGIAHHGDGSLVEVGSGYGGGR
jgi:hypothetical protein